MTIPQGYSTNGENALNANVVCKLNNYLYGLNPGNGMPSFLVYFSKKVFSNML